MKDEEIITTIVVIVLLIFVALATLVVVRGVLLSYDISNSDVCEFELGENWKYEYTQIFGKTCIELDYITLEIVNRTKFPYETNLEVSEKYCNPPKFFSLKNWNNGCVLQNSEGELK